MPLWAVSTPCRALLGDHVIHPDNTSHMVSSKQLICNMQDNFVELDEVVPPLQNLSPSGMAEVAEQTLIPIDVAGDRQYVASLRHGHIVDKATLMQLLKGEHPEQQMPGRPWDSSS